MDVTKKEKKNDGNRGCRKKWVMKGKKKQKKRKKKKRRRLLA